jgi:hypothetical protein
VLFLTMLSEIRLFFILLTINSTGCMVPSEITVTRATGQVFDEQNLVSGRRRDLSSPVPTGCDLTEPPIRRRPPLCGAKL